MAQLAVKILYPKVRQHLRLIIGQVMALPEVAKFLPDYPTSRLPDRDFFFTVSDLFSADFTAGAEHGHA